MSVGLFVDVNDQHFRINKKWPGRKLNYGEYYKKASEFGPLTKVIAYGTQTGKIAFKFIECLHHLGYEPKYKEVEEGQWFNWSIGMSIDMVENITKLDTVILGVSARDFVPLVKYLRDRDIKVIIMSCGINRELKLAANDWIELTEDMLETEISLAK